MGGWGETLLRLRGRGRWFERRLLNGARRFAQAAAPGREASVDFTDGRELGVTIAGAPFEHLWFEWVLSFSGWTYAELAPSESFEALVSGLQGALWTLGAAPAVVRHDSLSAATHELRRSGGNLLRRSGVLQPSGARVCRCRLTT